MKPSRCRSAARLLLVSALVAAFASVCSGAEPANLLKKSTFDDAVRRDYPTYHESRRVQRLAASNGRASLDRIVLKFTKNAAKVGPLGADLQFIEQANFYFWLPTKALRNFKKGEERMYLVRLWVRGEQRLEDGAYTRLRWHVDVGNEKGELVWGAKRKITIEYVAIPGAAEFPREREHRYFPGWTMLGGTVKAFGTADGGTIAGLTVEVAKKGGDPKRPMWMHLDQVEMFDVTNLSDKAICELMRSMTEETTAQRMVAIAGAAAKADKTPDRIGNHIRNASFETDGDYLWVLSGGSPVNPGAYVTGGAYHGRRALSFARLRRLDGRRSGRIESPSIPVRPFRKMVLSLWAKKEDAAKPASLALAVVDQAKPVKFSKGISEEWKRFSLPFTVGARLYGGIGLHVSGANVLIDAVQLEEGTEPRDFRDADDLSVSLVNDGKGNIQFADEPFDVTLQAAASNVAGGALEGKLVVTNVFGAKVAEKPVALRVPAARMVTEKIRFDPGLQGIFNVAVLRRNPHPFGLRETSETVITRVPHPRKVDPMRSIIGDTPYFNAFNISLLERLGVKWVRTIPSNISAFRWRMIEKKPGQQDWSWPEKTLAQLEGRSVAVLAMFNGAPEHQGLPRTYSSNHGGWAPADMSVWESFVHESVKRYSDKVAAWELWNEPSKAAGKRYYNKMQGHSFKALKRADPRAYLVGWSMPKATGGVSRYAAPSPGAELSLDGVDVHQYGPPSSGIIPYLLRAAGKMAGKIMIWNTECGLSQTASMYRATGRDAVERRLLDAAGMAQLVILHKAIEAKFIYYTSRFPHGATGMGGYSWGVIESTGVPTAGGVARAVAAHMVDGAKTVGYVNQDEILALVVQRDKQVVVAVFVYHYRNVYPPRLAPKTRRTITLPAVLRGGELYDMMNMPVGRTAGKLEINFTPLYIVFDGAAPAAVLNALRDAVGRK